MDMGKPIENAQDAALDYAWGHLQYTPTDLGVTKIRFTQDEVDVCQWNGYEQVPVSSYKAWHGSRTASTWEGYTNVEARVEPEITRIYEEKEVGGDNGLVYMDRVTVGFEYTGAWIVEISTDSRDCDGRYTSSHTVRFVEGEPPQAEQESQRDHSAEAAGY